MALKLKRNIVDNYQSEQAKIKKYTILLVDDEMANLDGLKQVLETEYNVITAISGAEAIDIINTFRSTKEIHLVITDQRMPQMNGVELLEQLIPLIPDAIRMVLTGFADINAIIDAINHGAVYKFLTKPIEPVELRITIQRALESLELSRQNKTLMNDLIALNTTLEHKVIERTLQLAEKQNDLEKINLELKQQLITIKQLSKLKEDVELITRHDLRSPLNAIIAFPQMLKKADNLTDKQKEKLDLIATAGYQMLEMINNSLDLYKMEIGTYCFKPIKIDLIPILEKVISENKKLLETKGISIVTLLNNQPFSGNTNFFTHGESLLCYTLLGNLIKNAIEASPNENNIHIFLITETDNILIKIRNYGCVPESIRTTFFDKYVSAGKDHGTGLGTYSAYLGAKVQGGSIHLDTSEGAMTSVLVKLPLAC